MWKVMQAVPRHQDGKIDGSATDVPSTIPEQQPEETTSEDDRVKSVPKSSTRTLLGKIFWTPRSCRYDPKSPPQFSLVQNVLFAFAGAFTVGTRS